MGNKRGMRWTDILCCLSVVLFWLRVSFSSSKFLFHAWHHLKICFVLSLSFYIWGYFFSKWNILKLFLPTSSQPLLFGSHPCTFIFYPIGRMALFDFSSPNSWMFLLLNMQDYKKAEHWRIDASEPWCWRRLLRVPWTARRSNQSILKEISPDYSL